MKNKLLIFSALIISVFALSACTVKDQAELKLLNKIDTKVDQKIEEKTTKVTPTIINETGNDTEAELLKQIDADTDPNLDTDFKNLNTQLGQ